MLTCVKYYNLLTQALRKLHWQYVRMLIRVSVRLSVCLSVLGSMGAQARYRIKHIRSSSQLELIHPVGDLASCKSV